MRRCNVCGGEATGRKSAVHGAHVEFVIVCCNPGCMHEETWHSNAVISQIYLINILLSAAIVFSGGLATKFFQALNLINLQTITIRTFYRHQKEYLHGVSIFYNKFQ